jgi:hypothetical protein
MRRGWKQLAERADNRAFAPDEISDAVIPALAQDWCAAVPDALAGRIRDILGGPQDSLFWEEKIAQLKTLRTAMTGRGFGDLLIEHAIQTVSEGKSGPDAAAETGAAALASWAARCARQVEEHYCRDSGPRRGVNVRTRIEEGIGRAPLEGLARELLKLGPRSVPRTAQKQTGLDDGVRL